ncbi:MAG: phosphoribosylanthranilate isomerase [Sebaldella sp.]|nr:phosphoribosylanthranilate isomerase [Sebaldella sp.]
MNKIKICGIRSLEEIKELAKLNIDYFGCIFAKSPRQVDLDLAKQISEIAHLNNKKIVGVFVNSTLDEINSARNNCNLDIIQLHGDESPEFCEELGGNIWKVFRVYDNIPDFSAYLDFIEYPLFDTKGTDYGGNGIIFDWKILEKIDYPYILAGGLSVQNIRKAKKYTPAIFDINSKVEINNRKSKELIMDIINIIK